MKYSNVVVAGGGVLGSQIAFQAAYCGFNVTIWLRSEGSIGRTQPKIDHLKQTYIEAIEKMAEDKNAWCAGLADEDTFDKEECLKKVENAYANLKLELDMAKAVADADLVIESMAENEKDKIAFYEKLSGQDCDCNQFIDTSSIDVCKIYWKTRQISVITFC